MTNIKKMAVNLFYCSCILFLFSCSKKTTEESVSPNDYPRIIATKPGWPLKNENGDLPVFNVRKNEVLQFTVMYSPTSSAVLRWIIDGTEVGTGGTFSFQAGEAKKHTILLQLSSPVATTTREGVINVYE
ncbi:hypothetical protein [Chitinophaga defluvii]|uniref:PKD domain-containing protein n=1 Tax=Chitinophaga defluvii TaxID=3163343 RepID=A0ABV2T0Y8_9BACT